LACVGCVEACVGIWLSSTTNCHPGDAGGHEGSGCQPGGGIKPSGAGGHPGGGL
jgi:hypothetical protein